MEINELYQMAADAQIDVDERRLPVNGSLSYMELDGACHIAIDTPRCRTQAEEKERLGHELGHCTTGAFYNRYSPYDLRGRHERRATKWAAYKLVPLDKLIDAFENGLSGMWELSEYFGVSEDFMRKALEI